MLPGVLELIPAAKVSVVGIKRDEESLAAKPYYENLVGDMADRTALILDPMLATGGTLVATVDMLKAAGATRIKGRSEEHTSELQSLMSNSYAVYCLQQKKYRIH